MFYHVIVDPVVNKSTNHVVTTCFIAQETCGLTCECDVYEVVTELQDSQMHDYEGVAAFTKQSGQIFV